MADKVRGGRAGMRCVEKKGARSGRRRATKEGDVSGVQEKQSEAISKTVQWIRGER